MTYGRVALSAWSYSLKFLLEQGMYECFWWMRCKSPGRRSYHGISEGGTPGQAKKFQEQEARRPLIPRDCGTESPKWPCNIKLDLRGSTNLNVRGLQGWEAQKNPQKCPAERKITFEKYSARKSQSMTFSIPFHLPSQTSVKNKLKNWKEKSVKEEESTKHRKTEANNVSSIMILEEGLSWKKGKHLILNQVHCVVTS